MQSHVSSRPPGTRSPWVSGVPYVGVALGFREGPRVRIQGLRYYRAIGVSIITYTILEGVLTIIIIIILFWGVPDYNNHYYTILEGFLTIILV